MKVINDIQLTENFKLSEFECDGKVMLDMRLVYELQKLRDIIKKPMTITSGYRTPEKNRSLKDSSPNSKHLYGIAADIKVKGMKPEEIYFIAKHLQFNGIGLYNHHLHVDVRDKKAFWDNRTVKTDLNNVFSWLNNFITFYITLSNKTPYTSNERVKFKTTRVKSSSFIFFA